MSKAGSSASPAPRISARALLSAEQLELIRARSDWKGLALVAHAWFVIFAAMALFAWWPNPLTFLLAAAIIGARQLGLSILMHDGAHDLLLKNRKGNLRLSQWLCAFPTLADTVAYRRYHLKHHAHAQPLPNHVDRRPRVARACHDNTADRGQRQQQDKDCVDAMKADFGLLEQEARCKPGQSQ